MAPTFATLTGIALLGGLIARRLARKTIAAGPSLRDDRLARTRGITIALGIALVLATPFVLLLVNGIRSLPADPLFFFSPWTLAAAIVVTPAMLVGYFPIRRDIFGDRWSCAAYVGWIARLVLAIGGPWTILFLGPSMTHVAEGGALITGTGLLVGLGLWLYFVDASARWLLDGRDDTHNDEEATRATIAAAAGVPDLRLRAMGPDDATFATILPLPTGRPPSLFVSRTFWEELGPAGRRGVFAREAARIAHTRSKSWVAASIPALILGASLVEPLLALHDPGLAAAYRWAWVGGFVLITIFLSGGQAKLEFDLDKRAAELLGGDSAARTTMEETLRAIAKLAHWPVAAMSGASPGTLSSRLAALSGDDGEDGLSAAPLEPVVFQSGADPSTWIAIDDTGIHKLSGVEPTDDTAPPDLDGLRAHAHQVLRLSFEELTYLALAPKRGSMGVLAVSGAGASIHVPIAPQDEERAGAVVAAASPRVRGGMLSPGVAMLGASVALGAIPAFSLSFSGWVPGGAVILLLFAALFVLLLWRRTTVAAYGSMALAAGVGALAMVPGGSVTTVDGLCMGLLVLSGVLALVTAARRAQDPDAQLPDGGAWMTGLVLLIASAPAVLGLVSATSVGHGALYLSGLAEGSGNVLFAWVGAGAALFVHPGKIRRSLALFLLIAGAGLGVARTDSWLENVADDPLAAGEPFTQTTRALSEPTARFSVPSDSWDLRITANGATVVYGSDLDGAPEHAPLHRHRYDLRSVDDPGKRAHLEGYALALGATERALLLSDAASGSGLELNWIDLWDPSRVHGSLPIDTPLPGEPDLRIVGERFVLTATDEETRVVASGPLGGDASSVVWRTEPVIRGVWPTFDGSTGFLEIGSSSEKRGPRLSLERVLWIFRPPVDLRTITWWADGSERSLARESAVEPWCELGSGGSTSLLCVAESENSRWLWQVHDDRELLPLGRTGAFGWWRWTGARLVALGQSELVVVDPAAKREIRHTLAAPTDHEVRFDAAGSAVVLGWPEGGALDVRVYRDLTH